MRYPLIKSVTITALIVALAGCSATKSNDVVYTGVLQTGTLALTNVSGKIEAFPPMANSPKDRYAVSQTSRDRSLRTLLRFNQGQKLLSICPQTCPPPADAPGADYLVRIPNDVHAQLTTANGDIDVSDVSGPVDAAATNGNIKIQIPSFANASTVNGNIAVTFGDANWPGALHFSTQHGDVELYVPAIANARVDLHTDVGTVYDNFDLRGTSQGTAETITGKIGSGGDRSIVVRVRTGNVRLLKLVPQM
ncbi:MAG: DUF4097 family beta strand repeat-containing protein [Candidatus Eremiobacteraeota bacterium]|nr:DUF4097 family beta strand repeat-containing protein [Candidatus Eremiobacteraeota bacterium]